jgi:AcrR family transcriptional regulator
LNVKSDAPPSRRDALVEAAYREIAAHGFEGLRTREIAAAVGMNIATLHYYFPSKEDLVRAVVGHSLARFQSTLARSGSAGQRLRGHFAGLRRLSREEPELFTVMAELMLRSARDRTLAYTIRKTNEYWQATVADLLRAARAERTIPRDLDPEGMAVVVVAALKGAYLLPERSTAPRTLERTLHQLEELLGLRHRSRA